MELTERRLEDLSSLEYRIFTCRLDEESYHEAMVLKFSGTYGVGSAGNDDAKFMSAITLAALSTWYASAVVFDLREFDYEWGNGIWDVVGQSGASSSIGQLPAAMVVSERCRPGFSTCAGIVPEMFDDLASAIEFVRPQALEPLTN